MKDMKNYCISLVNAKKLHIKKIFFTWPGLGDNLALSTAAKRYFEVHHERILIGTTLPELFLNTDHCYFTQEVNYNNFDASKDILKDLDIEPIFISATDMKQLPNGKYISIWSEQHFMASYFSRLGLSGKQNIVPYLKLSTEELKYGNLRKKQIAIMTDGLQNYKTYNFDNIQTIVNKLYKNYSFVQIGKKSDRKLQHCLDMTGKCSIRQTACILYHSMCFIGGIGGLMHLARAVNCPSVITCSLAEPISYACYKDNKNVYSIKGCNLCGRNVRDPQHQICENNYSCIRSLETKDVLDAILQTLNSPKQLPSSDIRVISSSKKDLALGIDIFEQQKNIQWCNEAFFSSPTKNYKLKFFGIPLCHISITQEFNKFVTEFKILNFCFYKKIKRILH